MTTTASTLRFALILSGLLLWARTPAATAQNSEQIAVSPSQPTTADSIQIIYSGIWPNACVPRVNGVVRQGNVLIFASSNSGEACTLAPTPFRTSAPLGQLPAGIYEVVVTYNGRERGRSAFTVSRDDGSGGSNSDDSNPPLAVLLGGPLLAAGGPVSVEILQGNRAAIYTSDIWLVRPQISYLATGREVGKTFDLGFMPAGAELVFAIQVRQTRHTFYTGTASRNPDGVVHTIVTYLPEARVDVGFEDLFGGGDLGFNDVRLRVSGIRTIAWTLPR